MAELVNCIQCGKIFVKTSKAICPSCRKEVERKFEVVYNFIKKKENRQASIQEVKESTEVETNLIYQWIQEGRLNTTDFPNLTYPCQSCGDPIQKGKLCDGCTTKLKQEVTQSNAVDDIARKRVVEGNRAITYHTKK